MVKPYIHHGGGAREHGSNPFKRRGEPRPSTLAAALASGLDGIANQIEPPAIFEGDVYSAQELPHVPYTLREATDRFAKSDFVQQTFGADVVEHYTHFFRTEQAAYDMAVTDWERQRYFERI